MIVHQGDCLEVMRTLADNSVDAVVTDPPYGWRFMGKAWDAFDLAGVEANRAFQAFTEGWAAEAYRVLKPGGHMVVFCGPRTYHRMASGVEDAGFEIRDQLQWLFGSGFPKSMDISKAIDKAAGARGHDSAGFNAAGLGSGLPSNGGSKFRSDHPDYVKPEGLTADAKQWQGWGTALKPANEPIVLARKPLSEKTVAKNVLKHGTGGLNIDASRIGCTDPLVRPAVQRFDNDVLGKGLGSGVQAEPTGRWPSNVILACDCADDQLPLIHKDDCAVTQLDMQSGVLPKGGMQRGSILKGNESENTCMSGKNYARTTASNVSQCSGDYGASRFFYVAKTSKRERNAGLNGMAPTATKHDARPCDWENADWSKVNLNHHPTVKPIKLMEYLIRMITPPGGVVLDPFTGSGSTGVACKRLSFDFIGIEREPDYVAIAQRRIDHA